MAGIYNDEKWIGQKFNMLTVEEAVKRSDGWSWRMKCECGGETVARPIDVISGKYVSCGCRRKNRKGIPLTHGMSHTPLHNIGSSGLQLGKNFKVDMQGRVTASDGEFTGTVHAGKISYGDNSGGYLNGAGLSSASVGTGVFTSGVNTSLAYADYSDGVFKGYNTAPQIACTQMSAKEVLMDGMKLGMQTITYKDSTNESHSINVVTWSRGGPG